MFRKSVVSIVLVTLVLTVTVPLAKADLNLLGNEAQCDWQVQVECDKKDRCNMCASQGWRDGVIAARQDLFLDFNLGFWGGPFAFAPDLLSSICTCGEQLCSCKKKELPWWRTPRTESMPLDYKQDFERAYWRTKRGNKLIAKLAGWGTSIVVIQVITSICCG